MSKTVNNSTASSITTTDYLTGFQYTGGTMAFFPHAEGYVNVRTGPAYNYVFNYAAPFIAIGILIYGIADYTFEINDKIDAKTNEVKILD